MTKKETAFNTDITYRDLAILGKKIGSNSDSGSISNHLEKMKSNDSIEAQRSAAIMSNTADINPELFIPFVPELIGMLGTESHRAVSRIALRILEKNLPIPNENLGTLIDKCFKYLNNAKYSIAEKVFAMSIIAEQALTFPELKIELEASLQSQYENASPGVKSRAKKIAKRLKLKIP